MTDLLARLHSRQAAVTVVGLGYVGLPLAVCLAKRFRVVGHDLNRAKVEAIAAGRDPLGEIPDAALAAARLAVSADPACIEGDGVVIVTVPTPVDAAYRPDFGPLVSASEAVGRRLRPGGIVVYESTVYPGATEEICVPVLERASGLKAGRDFAFGYSPERINVGDRERTIERIVKVVGASSPEARAVLCGMYGAVIPAGVHPASNVAVAEAAKAVENAQRDVNIAFVNEVALICNRTGIDTREVLAAAGTKWNFLPFSPGLVGGHCIAVDPWYLAHKAETVGVEPRVITAARRVNDAMGRHVARECVLMLARAHRPVSGARVLVLGLAFKEDCADVRNSRVVEIVDELRRFGAEPVVVDPVADPVEARRECRVDLVTLAEAGRCEAVVAAVAHRAFRSLVPADLAACTGPGAPFLDIKAAFDPALLTGAGFMVWRL